MLPGEVGMFTQSTWKHAWRGIVAAIAITAAAFQAAAAQGATTRRFEVRPLAGGYVSTGVLNKTLDDAVLVGGQLGYAITPRVGVTASFGWSPTNDITHVDQTGSPTAAEPDVDLFQYDAGLELNIVSWKTANGWSIEPFVGGGAGARTYHKDVGDDQTDFAGYGALGLRFDGNRFGLRAEARDYLSNFDGLNGNLESITTNDLSLFGAVVVRF